jgi:hypothetical protein
MEGETHFLLSDSCFTPTYGILRIDGYVDPLYLNQYVEVEGEQYDGLLCIMIDVETITLLGDPNQDTDEDGENDACDNCPSYPNGPNRGTCTMDDGINLIVRTGQFCTVDADCDPGEFCEKTQTDTYPSPGNGIGDACDCESDFHCDTNVDATDVTCFLIDFGRNQFNNPCTNERVCCGDFDCNGRVDAGDLNKLFEDFGRSQFNNPCPACVAGDWCVYTTTTTTAMLCLEEEESCNANSQCCNGCCCPAFYFPDPVCWPIALCVELDPYVPCLQ